MRYRALDPVFFCQKPDPHPYLSGTLLSTCLWILITKCNHFIWSDIEIFSLLPKAKAERRREAAEAAKIDFEALSFDKAVQVALSMHLDGLKLVDLKQIIEVLIFIMYFLSLKLIKIFLFWGLHIFSGTNEKWFQVRFGMRSEIVTFDYVIMETFFAKWCANLWCHTNWANPNPVEFLYVAFS